MGKRKFHRSGDHGQVCQTELNGYISLQTAYSLLFRQKLWLIVILIALLVFLFVFLVFLVFPVGSLVVVVL